MQDPDDEVKTPIKRKKISLLHTHVIGDDCTTIKGSNLEAKLDEAADDVEKSKGTVSTRLLTQKQVLSRMIVSISVYQFIRESK